MELKNIAIIGPRGNTGTAILQELLKDLNFNITALTRPTSTYTAPSPLIRIHPTDFASPSSLASAFQNQDAVLCCTPGGSVQFDTEKLMIDAAIAAGVKLYFANEYVGDIYNPLFMKMPMQVVGDKRAVRKYLEQKAEEGRIAWTAVNGGPFFDMWLIRGPAGFDIPGRRARIYGSGENVLCWTPLPVVAGAVVNMIRNPERILNRPIFVNGVKNLTQKALLVALEAEIGEKFVVENVDIAKIKEQSARALEEGDVARAMRGLTLSGQFYDETGRRDLLELQENDAVGMVSVTVEEAVRETLLVWGTEVQPVQAFLSVRVEEE